MAESSAAAAATELPTTTPLLRHRQDSAAAATQPTTLAALLGRATGRRGASMLVRETAARQLDERRADWGYSKPVVALDMVWNLAFVVVSVVTLICTVEERPNVLIRVWICGYSLQCLVHVVLVWLEYRRRNRTIRFRDVDASTRTDTNSVDANDSEDEETGGALGISSRSSWTTRCESVNTMASFLWWIVGFYWVVSGGNILLHNAPRLYWLAVVFLAFDVFFAIFCVVLACLIGIALCCCLPCIIAILYAVAGQEGASDADLSILPKYKFQISGCEEKPGVGGGRMVPDETSSGCLANERIILPEDALHSKKRNRLEQRLNDLAFVKYNRTLRFRYDMRNTLDPISLQNIDESNEWLLGRMDGESDEDNEPVFDDDDGLTWATVARASGVEESSHASRATSSRSKAQPRISKSSTLTPLQLIDEEEAGSDDTEEEDVEGYKSTDGEEDDSLLAIDVEDDD